MRILFLEDDDSDAWWVERALTRSAFDAEVTRARTAAEARALLLQGQQADQAFDILLCDLHVPDSTPRTVLSQVLGDQRDLPVVVLTGSADDELAARLIEDGVQDYVSKNDLSVAGLARALRLARARMAREDRLYQLAARDGLTGACNRPEFERRLQRHLDGWKTSRDAFSLALIDVDRFKTINDSRGHLFGDAVLRATAAFITDNIRTDDTLGRLGGDEFVVLLAGLPGGQPAVDWQRRLMQRLASRGVRIDDERWDLSLSVGIAACPSDGETSQALLAGADAAMYADKRARACVTSPRSTAA